MVASYTVIGAAGDYNVDFSAEAGRIIGFKSPVFISTVASVYLSLQVKV